MATMQQLLFAQQFPYTGAARKVVEAGNLSLEKLPEQVVERAVLMVEHAASGKKYALELHNTELLQQEILAFPVAKILVSFVRDDALYGRFASLFADSTLHYLNASKDTKEAAIALAGELGLRVDFAEGNFLVSLPLLEFLGARFSDQQLKLVNQHLEKGRVFLDLNGLTRFLQALVFARLLSSLPVPVEGLPKLLVERGQKLQQVFREKRKKQFQGVFRGKVNADAFPPCVASMYSQLLEGKNVPHMGRFILASFLNRVGMPKQQMLELFKKAPNFSARVTAYQLDRIVKQNYTPASCTKIRTYGLCTNPDCNVKNPLGFYRRRLRSGK